MPFPFDEGLARIVPSCRRCTFVDLVDFTEGWGSDTHRCCCWGRTAVKADGCVSTAESAEGCLRGLRALEKLVTRRWPCRGLCHFPSPRFSKPSDQSQGPSYSLSSLVSYTIPDSVGTLRLPSDHQQASPAVSVEHPAATTGRPQPGLAEHRLRRILKTVVAAASQSNPAKLQPTSTGLLAISGKRILCHCHRCICRAQKIRACSGIFTCTSKITIYRD